MTFAVRNRGRQQRQRVCSDRLSFPPHLVPPQAPPRGPAPRSARTGCWKPDVAECACARSGPSRRSALVTTSPYLALETRSVRKRRGRPLCPAPLAGSTVTIGLQPARRLLGRHLLRMPFHGSLWIPGHAAAFLCQRGLLRLSRAFGP